MKLRRYPSILPILEADYAADKTVEAILTSQAYLMMPRFIYVVYFLKGYDALFGLRVQICLETVETATRTDGVVPFQVPTYRSGPLSGPLFRRHSLDGEF